MRIAVVVSSFPLISETFILNQITGLIDLGHRVDILSLHKPLANTPLHEAVLKYNLLSKTKYFEIPRKQIKRILRSIKIILINLFISPQLIIKCLTHKEFSRYQKVDNLIKLEPFIQKNYDIVHCHFGPIAQEFFFIKDYFPSIKFFTSFHGHDVQIGLTKGKSFYEELFKKSNYFLFPSRFCRDTMESLGCPMNKNIIHFNGIDTKKFNPSIKTHLRNHLHVTTIARLHEDKNLSLALEIIEKIIVKHKIKITFNIIGEGPERSFIEQKIQDLQLQKNVVLWGALSQDKVLKILAETDVLLLTSHHEGFGIVLLEAQAIGIPVVATAVDGVPEAVSTDSAFLFPLSNPNQAVDHLLNLILNAQLRQKMGEAGVKLIKNNFDIDLLNNHLIKIFSKK